MPIRSKNISDNNSYNEFAQSIISIPLIDFGVAKSSASIGGVRIPWAFKILSAAVELLESSGSTTVAVAVDGTAGSNVLTASTSAQTFTMTTTTGSAGSYIGIVQDNGNVATVRANGIVSVTIRPYLGVPERVAAGLGEL